MASSSKGQKRNSKSIDRPPELSLHLKEKLEDGDTTELPKNGELSLPATPAAQGSSLLSPYSANQSRPRLSLRRARSDLDAPLSPLPSPSSLYTFSRHSQLSTSSSLTSTPPYSPSGELFPPSIGGKEGSMILYRLASASGEEFEPLIPPSRPGDRSSGASSTSLASNNSLSGPLPATSRPLDAPRNSTRGLIPYRYDPLSDTESPMDEEDLLHDPETDVTSKHEKWEFPWRGVVNLSFLVFIVLALLALFALYPMFQFYRDKSKNDLIIGNIRINATGQNDSL
ncbi:hypothetical protein CPB83DRAFT_849172 [Crepidotus variabilis]|uniref:Uncharacterized protein n=1 Tax=Crepidotus variabilis TaxID=179855 RepID=A0A9P6EMI0_9AGAR|nr:hypothetical protein CPB83DRAFT_849172 [Crepidotus variabilis]